jgi:hypothetical protein
VYNMVGQRITRLMERVQEAGRWQATWSAQHSSGIFFYTLEAISIENPSKRFKATRKMVLLR